MPHPAAAAADGAVGDTDGVGALPRLVAVPPAVEALELVLLEGAVEDVEVVHVLGAQGDHPGAVGVLDLAGKSLRLHTINPFQHVYSSPCDLILDELPDEVPRLLGAGGGLATHRDVHRVIQACQSLQYTQYTHIEQLSVYTILKDTARSGVPSGIKACWCHGFDLVSMPYRCLFSVFKYFYRCPNRHMPDFKTKPFIVVGHRQAHILLPK